MKLNKNTPVKQAVKQEVVQTVKQPVTKAPVKPTIPAPKATEAVKQVAPKVVAQAVKPTPINLPINLDDAKLLFKPEPNETAVAQEQKGIMISDKYMIQTLDVLNVVLKEKYIPKPKVIAGEPTEDSEDIEEPDAEVPEGQWKIVAFCASIELAFKVIVNREINITINKGLEEVVKKVAELKTFKTKLVERCSSENE